MKKDVVSLGMAAFLSVVLSCCDASDSSAEPEPVRSDIEGANTVLNHESNTPSPTQSENMQNVDLRNDSLPTIVLVGTDVSDRSSYTPSKISTGEYASEMGGATLRISVREISEGNFSIRRSYNEPGQAESEKLYSGLVKTDNQLVGSSVVVEFVSHGVLWWEKESGNEFISNELLLFLEGTK